MRLTPAGGPHVRHVRSFAIGWRASKQCWGVTAGKPRHNSSNVRGVTAGKWDATLVEKMLEKQREVESKTR